MSENCRQLERANAAMELQLERAKATGAFLARPARHLVTGAVRATRLPRDLEGFAHDARMSRGTESGRGGRVAFQARRRPNWRPVLILEPAKLEPSALKDAFVSSGAACAEEEGDGGLFISTEGLYLLMGVQASRL